MFFAFIAIGILVPIAPLVKKDENANRSSDLVIYAQILMNCDQAPIIPHHLFLFPHGHPSARTRIFPTPPSAETAWTTSTTALKLNGSYIANPLKIFLSKTIPLVFCIWMNFEYDSPYCLTPALSLWIHSLRNSRFLTLRSR